MTTKKMEKDTRKQPRGLKLQVIIKKDEKGFFAAEIPMLPGCLSQGKTKEEALVNIKDAAELYIKTVGKSDFEVTKNNIITHVEVIA